MSSRTALERWLPLFAVTARKGSMMLVEKNVALPGVPREAMPPGGAKTTLMSMLSSVGAVLAACSCCILPMALAGLGLSTGFGSVLTAIGPLRWPMAGLSVLMLIISWLVVIRQRQKACGCGAPHVGLWLRTPRVLMLMMATVLTLIAVSWGAFEPALMRAML